MRLPSSAIRNLAVLLCHLFSALAVAGTIHVPGDYPSLQAAIDAAEDGDLIQLEPGITYDSATIDSKTLTLVGGPEPYEYGIFNTAYIPELRFSPGDGSLEIRNCSLEDLIAAGGRSIEVDGSRVYDASISDFETARLVGKNQGSAFRLVDCDAVAVVDGDAGHYSQIAVQNSFRHGTVTIGKTTITSLILARVDRVEAIGLRRYSYVNQRGSFEDCRSVRLNDCYFDGVTVTGVDAIEFAWCQVRGRSATPDRCEYCGLGNFYCLVEGGPCSKAMEISNVPDLKIIGGAVAGGAGANAPTYIYCRAQDYPSCADMEVSSNSRVTIYTNNPPDEIVRDTNCTVEVLPLAQFAWIMH
ncbi:hypothetical protein GC173_07155 [bacterium]|nr:hypothetical protein [bacterium]